MDRYGIIMKQVALGLLTFIASLALAGFNPAQAQATSNPNILLVLDTSGSMNLTASSSSQVAPYNPSTSYPDNGANCSSTSVYYWPKSKGAAPTSCSATGLLSFNRSSYLNCKSVVSALDGLAGYYGTNDSFIRLSRTGSNYIWVSDISTATLNVECKADNGVYGQSMTTADSKYPKAGNNGSVTSAWTTSSGSQWWSDTNVGGQYYLFSPNYIRYLHAPPLVTTRASRLNEVKAAVSTFLSSISNSTVNVGLMRYDSNAHGGMVIQPIKPLDDAYATTLTNSVNDFQPYGGTPLSETLYEAYQYLRGGPVTYGNSSQVCSSISNASSNANGSCSGSLVNLFSTASSRVGGIASSNTYNSPLVNASAATANNLIIFLTDGEPTSDIESNSAINTLTGASCSTDGACLDDLANYMFNHNLVSGSNSTVKTHFIGFGSDIGGNATAQAYLQAAATAGGGWLYLADSNSSLRDALDAILADALGSGISSYTLSGTISGLAPGKAVTLVNNGNDVLTQDVDGEFMFSNQLAAGASYSVPVAIQPSGQICTVNNGAGIINANITNIGVNCVSTYTVSGSLTGLSASGLVLRLNSANLIVANGATTFKFASTLTSNSTYTVSVGIQPAGYICSVVNGFGTITNANITNVSVECAKTYTVGGSITGLTKAGLILKLNGGATKIVASGAMSYTFSTSLTAGTAYLVTLQSPDGLICTAANNSGVMGTANLTNANIACTTQ